MQLAQYKLFFLREARNRLKQIEDAVVTLERNQVSGELLDSLLSNIHILKSDAATMDYQNLANALHQTEDVFIEVKNKKRSVTPTLIDDVFILLDAINTDLENIKSHNTEIDLSAAVAFTIRKEGAADISESPVKKSDQHMNDPDRIYRPMSTYVQVSSEQMEQTLDMVNDLVSQNQSIMRSVAKGDLGETSIGIHSQATKLSGLRRVMVDLKMMPVRQYFVFLSRLVRDLSRQGKKFIKLEMVDNNLRFEKQILESLREICVQLIRNAVEHGFSEGQSGVVVITFEFRANKVFVTVVDTGNGIDWDAIAKHAVQKKKIASADLQRLSPAKRHRYLFEHGVSSRDTATLSSGRGIGWNAVRDTVQRLNGIITFKSWSGRKKHGTEFIIEIPLPPTMFRALIWKWGDYAVAMPLFVVNKIIQLPEEGKRNIGKRFRLNKHTIPIISMAQVLHPGREKIEESIGAIAVIESDKKLFGITVPPNISEQELIIKKIPCLAKNPLVAGVAITENSTPVIIINHKALRANHV